MVLFKFIVLLLAFVQPSFPLSTPESPTYTAGVVEFSPQAYGALEEERVQQALEAYLEIIRSDDAKDVDIIVFPESTFNSRNYPFVIPDPEEKISPCGNANFDTIIQQVSCSAIETKKYVVINLTEKKPTSSETLHYNSNVVFDRNGIVVSKYRKWNLYGEAGINVTDTSDISFFTTDFNVTFGHFICFDIMFETPALKLIDDHNISDILYPTMWFSQLPFLTAIQVQAAWAYRNQVNFLAAGASNQGAGSTGTGIYSGKTGPIVTLMSPIKERKLLVAQVLKKQFWNTEEYNPGFNNYEFAPSEMSDLFLKRDNLELYNTKPLEMTLLNGKVEDSVCFGDTCCYFDVTYSKKSTTSSGYSYEYRVTAFDGVKSNRGTLTCAIVACTNSTLASCGTRFGKYEVVDENITFESISVQTIFRNNIFALPNVLTTSIVPTPNDHFKYDEQQVMGPNSVTVRNITITLLQPHSNLYTFGIFGRDFIKDILSH